MPISIREARPSDAPSLVDAHYKSWLATYPSIEAQVTPEMVKRRFEVDDGGLAVRVEHWKATITEGGNRQVYVAVQNDRVVGFILAERQDDGTGLIGSLYLLPHTQGQGVGKQLMRRALTWLQAGKIPVYLGVVETNKRAIRFYESFGFVYKRKKPLDTTGIVMQNIEMVRLPAPID